MPVIKSIGYRVYNVFRNAARKIARRQPHPSSGTSLPITSQLRVVKGKRIELPFANEAEYQCFLEAVVDSLSNYDQVQEIVEGEAAYVNLGGPYGTNLTGLEGVHSLIGWDRAYSVVLGPRKSFCVKGPGASRSKKLSYQANLESYREDFLEEQEDLLHLPHDRNIRAQFKDHENYGGNDQEDLVENALGAYTLLKLAYGIDGRTRGIGGMVLPLGIHQILSFPFPKKDKNGNIRWKNVPGWNYFTNIKIMRDKRKIIDVAAMVEAGTKSKVVRFASRRFIKNAKKGKRASRLIRWLVGRAFMKLYKPATYEYIADEFRIGYVYGQLISNGFDFQNISLVEHGLLTEKRLDEAKRQGVSPISLVDNKDLKNKFMDKALSLVFALFGKEIILPENTTFDLQSKEGRLSYLKQVRKLNRKAAREITEQIAKEIGRQLGILHGCGGNGGGIESFHRFGDVIFALEKPDGENRALFVRLRLINSKKEYTAEIYDKNNNYFDSEMDLSNYKIVGIIQGEEGIFGGYGAPGGGITESRNVGFGLRDLHSLATDPEMLTITRFFPDKINGLPIEEQLFHYHNRLVQEVDLELLFARRVEGDRMQTLKGAFYRLNEIFGGESKQFNMIADAFWGNYNKYFKLSREKYASEVFGKVDRENPIYSFNDTFRALEMKDRIIRHIENADKPQEAVEASGAQGPVAI
jgi:hypothetical protein